MIDAILWDYDGTLADSAAKNRAVTLEVLRRVDPALLKPLPAALASPTAYRAVSRRYRNWMDLYEEHYRMTPDQIRRAAPLWAACQEAEPMAPVLFDGIPALLERLAGLPMAICSQNSAASIDDSLTALGIRPYFGAVAGFDTVGMERQKPEPDCFLYCLEKLGLTGGRFLYVGDQAGDLTFAVAAERALRERGVRAEVLGVAALWSGAEPETWAERPAAQAAFPGELEALARTL